MKKLILLFALLATLPAFAQIKSANLTASGLTCSMCSKAIYKALLKVPSIQTVDANIEKSSYAIVFKPGAKVEVDDVKKAVVGAGFSVASLQVTAVFDHVEVANDAHIIIGGNTFHFLNVPKQTLEGEKTVTIVDKNYLTAAEHKKFGKYTTMKCFETGVLGSCCPGDKSTAKRVYHVTL